MATLLTGPDAFLREEALKMLDGRSAILATARELSSVFRAAGIQAPVIGGVSVFLHGHIRTTIDIDVFTSEPPSTIKDLLVANGFVHDPVQREFLRDGIPVQLVLPDQLGHEIRTVEEIDGITTVSLPDLVEMKLRSGTTNMLRAQDIADVIGLIRRNGLRGDFARYIDKSLRPEFRKFAKAING